MKIRIIFTGVIFFILTGCVFSQVSNGQLIFSVHQDNSLSLTVDFEFSSKEDPSTYLILIPFNIKIDEINHSKNCLVSSYMLENNSLVFIKILDISYNINFTSRKIAKINPTADDTMREMIDFSFSKNEQSILNNIIYSNNYIGFQDFEYSVKFAPEINQNTTIVNPKINGNFSDITKNAQSIIIQYTNPEEFENIIAQSIMAFMVSIVTLILTLFFVDLDKIRESRKKTISFTIVISLFILSNIIVVILLISKIWVNILIPLVSFMTPNSLAFIFLLVNLFRPKQERINSELAKKST